MLHNMTNDAILLEREEESKRNHERTAKIIEEAKAQKAFFLTFVAHLEQCHDAIAQRAAAEFRIDREGQELQRWYEQREARRFLRRWMKARIREARRLEKREQGASSSRHLYRRST